MQLIAAANCTPDGNQLFDKVRLEVVDDENRTVLLGVSMPKFLVGVTQAIEFRVRQRTNLQSLCNRFCQQQRNVVPEDRAVIC